MVPRSLEPRTPCDDFQTTPDKFKVIATGGPNPKQSLTGRVRILSSPLRTGLAQSHRISARRSHPITEVHTDAAIGAAPIQLYFGKGNMAVVGKGFAAFQSHNVHASGFAACLTWAAVHI